MFRMSWTFAHFRGVPLRLHVSLLLILPMIAAAVAFQNLPLMLGAIGISAGALSVPPIAIGIGVAVAVFVAVLLHELGHAVAALNQGGRVRAITLMILGGVTELEHDDATPRQALWVALAGPLVNLVLAYPQFQVLFLHFHLLCFLRFHPRQYLEFQALKKEHINTNVELKIVNSYYLTQFAIGLLV